MDEVFGGVFVKGVPAELVGDLVELGGPEVGGFGDGEGGEVLVGAGGEDAVEPGLFVFVAGGSEGGANQRGFFEGNYGRWVRRLTVRHKS